MTPDDTADVPNDKAAGMPGGATSTGHGVTAAAPDGGRIDITRPRCWWPDGLDPDLLDPLMVAYHDDEWGVPVADDVALFERLALESFQAGLSWTTILRKREAFRTAFADFVPSIVAEFGEDDVERLMGDSGIVRSRPKIAATIGNAAGVLALAAEHGSFARYLAAFTTDPVPRRDANERRGDAPSTTPASVALSADLRRRGFRFVGPTIVYAFMQSVGMVDDHMPGCWRYGQAPHGWPAG